MSILSPRKTPKTPSAAHGLIKANVQTPSNPSGSYRLLYRGALSLPDSHIVLDGLTFAVKLDSPVKSVSSLLLENNLALALESMRGRPSLQLMGVVKLADLWMDESGGVEMDIHPRAILSRIYFENTFCLKPFPERNGHPSIKSDIGVKIALGDSGGPETTNIVVYAHLSPAPSPEANAPQQVQLKVARLTAKPAPRGPRPDDVKPRVPPIIFTRDMQRVESKPELKRVASGSLAVPMKRAKTVSNLGSGVRLAPGADVFKVPEVPPPKQQGQQQPVPSKKGKEKAVEKEDVFGTGRAECVDLTQLEDDDEMDGNAVDRVNRNKIKKATVAHLAQTKDPAKKGATFDKNHPDFKEFYAAVYRGVCFAVRGRIRLETVDAALIDRLLVIHTKLYLTGLGPPPR